MLFFRWSCWISKVIIAVPFRQVSRNACKTSICLRSSIRKTGEGKGKEVPDYTGSSLHLEFLTLLNSYAFTHALTWLSSTFKYFKLSFCLSEKCWFFGICCCSLAVNRLVSYRCHLTFLCVSSALLQKVECLKHF